MNPNRKYLNFSSLDEIAESLITYRSTIQGQHLKVIEYAPYGLRRGTQVNVRAARGIHKGFMYTVGVGQADCLRNREVAHQLAINANKQTRLTMLAMLGMQQSLDERREAELAAEPEQAERMVDVVVASILDEVAHLSLPPTNAEELDEE